jgi:hypothetical protein
MSIKVEHLWMGIALLAGFAVGVWYVKETSAKMYLASLPAGGGTNGTASIPVYGMVTAAQGLADGGN